LIGELQMKGVGRALIVAGIVACLLTEVRADDWPQWLGPRRDSNWGETGILESFPPDGPRVLWRVPIAGGYAGPAVADGRVYVTDFQTDANVNDLNDPGKRPELKGTERILCLDAGTGQEIWKKAYECQYAISYPAGPRCTPTVHDGKVYTLGAEGNLYCLNAATGQEIWKRDFKRDFGAKTPVWGFCGHPLIEGKTIICLVGGQEGVVYALNKDTGKVLWHALDASEPGYSAPSIIEAGGVRQLIIWHPESINGLDPVNGKVYWSVPLKPQYGMSIMAPRKSGDFLFAGGIGFQSLALKLDSGKPAVTEAWRGNPKSSVCPVNMTPYLEEGIIYGVDQPGQFRAVRLATGERLWETFRPVTGVDGGRPLNSGTAFVVKNGDRFFLLGETGHLIIARLSPKGYDEVSRWQILEPTGSAFGRNVLWSHPAFANKCVYARNDKELICVSLAAE
jgi:outer membrane protein assembly factor BamB